MKDERFVTALRLSSIVLRPTNMSPANRSKMLASVIRESIAPFLRELPRECGIVSITRVDVSTDLSWVTVFISSLDKPEMALAALGERMGEMRGRLSSLALRKVPMLRFRQDVSLLQANRIEKILDDTGAQES